MGDKVRACPKSAHENRSLDIVFRPSFMSRRLMAQIVSFRPQSHHQHLRRVS